MKAQKQQLVRRIGLVSAFFCQCTFWQCVVASRRNACGCFHDRFELPSDDGGKTICNQPENTNANLVVR